MMASLCIKVVYDSIAEKNIIVPDTQVYHSQERQQSGKRNTIQKHSRSDPIHCVTMMKLVRSVLAYKEQP